MNSFALIIGNGKYTNENHNLKNPETDASKVKDAFEKLGIKTSVKYNCTNREIYDEIENFSEILNKYQVGIFYFAGHGFEYQGENYLCGSDTDIESTYSIKHCETLSSLFSSFENTKASIKIIILDCCREIPSDSRGTNIKNPMIISSAPVGTFVEFSTSSECEASDGKGDNSPFCKAFIDKLGQPKVDISDLFISVRNDLYCLTEGKQISWDYSSLRQRFFFYDPDDMANKKYDSSVLADHDFLLSDQSPLHDIITKLKSLNWYNQNEAFTDLNEIDFNMQYDEGDLFILGRNIYQAGCSTSIKADDYFRKLKSNLLRFSEDNRKQIFSGMCYEIFFNKENKIRSSFKTGRLKEVMNLLVDEKFQQSAIFVENKLLQLNNSHFYFDFLKKEILNIEIYTIKRDDKYKVFKITINNSENLFYDHTGLGEITQDNLSDWNRRYTQNQLNQYILEVIAGHKSFVKFSYPSLTEEKADIYAPYHFKLLNKPLLVPDL